MLDCKVSTPYAVLFRRMKDLGWKLGNITREKERARISALYSRLILPGESRVRSNLTHLATGRNEDLMKRLVHKPYQALFYREFMKK